MKFMTVLALLISTSASASLFDSIESVDVIQKEVQARNAAQNDRKPASTEETKAAPSEESSTSKN